MASHAIQLARLLSQLVLKGAAALNAQQASGVSKAETPQLWPNRHAFQHLAQISITASSWCFFFTLNQNSSSVFSMLIMLLCMIVEHAASLDFIRMLSTDCSGNTRCPARIIAHHDLITLILVNCKNVLA